MLKMLLAGQIHLFYLRHLINSLPDTIHNRRNPPPHKLNKHNIAFMLNKSKACPSVNLSCCCYKSIFSFRNTIKTQQQRSVERECNIGCSLKYYGFTLVLRFKLRTGKCQVNDIDMLYINCFLLQFMQLLFMPSFNFTVGKLVQKVCFLSVKFQRKLHQYGALQH